MANWRRRQRKTDGDGKIMKATSAGMTLEHCLTRLVVCECNGSMIVNVSGGKSRSRTYHYVYRQCPRSHNGACDNHRYIREDDLEKAVFTRQRARLLPAVTEDGEVPNWFPEIVALAQERSRRRARERSRSVK